jgi:hypothetical protein
LARTSSVKIVMEDEDGPYACQETRKIGVDPADIDGKSRVGAT